LFGLLTDLLLNSDRRITTFWQYATTAQKDLPIAKTKIVKPKRISRHCTVDNYAVSQTNFSTQDNKVNERNCSQFRTAVGH
jgi:hypothetical protein